MEERIEEKTEERSTEKSAEMVPKAASFTAEKKEIIGALLMLAAGFLYACGLLAGSWEATCAWYTAFTAAFLLIVELLCRGRRFPAEAGLWLAGILIPLAALWLEKENVWESGHSFLFMHGFAVYYVLCRSGALIENESGSYLLFDLFNGFVTIPFGRYFFKLRTLSYGVLHKRSRSDETRSRDRLLWSVLAVILGTFLFIKAVKLLAASEESFSRALTWLSELFVFEWNEMLILKLILMLPVSSYLFGLAAGACRRTRQQAISLQARTELALEQLRRVPCAVWEVMLAAFILLYLLFFVLQAPYFLGGFTGTLPEDYIASRYAREGFFELCKVLAVNFALLWLANASGDASLRSRRSGCVLVATLLVEGILLAAVAASKLWLYIARFGTTPRRLEAAWLIAVLAVGCGCTLYGFLRQKNTAKIFILFAAASALLMYVF